MVYNFKTEDGEQWMVDTEQLNWARVSSIAAAPSVRAAESSLANFIPVEEGRLIPLGGGRYAFEGRQPFDAQHKAHLAVVNIVSLLTAEEEGRCVTFLQANVPVKDFKHQEIKGFSAEVLPPFKMNPRPSSGLHVVPPREPHVLAEEK